MTLHAGPPAVATGHRIALVTECLALGGSTTFLCNLGSELIRRGIPVQVLSFEVDHPLESDFAQLKIPVHRGDERRQIFEDRAAAIVRHLRAFAPSAVIGCLGSTSYEILRYAPAGVKRAAMIQSDDPGMVDAVRNYAPWLDFVAVVSRRIESAAGAAPELQPVPIRYLPYGVAMPADERRPQRDVRQPLRILYLGRLEPVQKRVRLFPAILERLKSSGIPFQWTIAGTGPELEYLRRTLQTEDPGQSVVFLGQVPYAEVPALMTQQDIFLLASDFEGLPLSLLEAMGWGVVPVVSDLPSGIPEVVDATTGRLVPPADVAGYADAIIGLHQDRLALQRLSQNAAAKVRQLFSIQAMTDRWLEALSEPSQSPAGWPERVRIRPILGHHAPFYFEWGLARGLRRLRKRLSG
jgi:glycosyltransferase involved in cell wall biosynthesis